MATSLSITAFDHLVLKVADVEASLTFYIDRLGLEPINVDEWRNGSAFFPSARISADSIIDFIPAAGDIAERNVDHFCLVADRASVEAITAPDSGFEVVDSGERSGARGIGWSVYINDPDGNLVEVRYYE